MSCGTGKEAPHDNLLLGKKSSLPVVEIISACKASIPWWVIPTVRLEQPSKVLGGIERQKSHTVFRKFATFLELARLRCDIFRVIVLLFQGFA